MFTSPVTATRTDPRNRWALGLIAAAQFMVIMDTSIIGVALPQIGSDLGFTPENLSWVFNAFVVAFGGLLLLGGKLTDLLGARRVFSAGWVTLLAGSVLAGLAGGVPAELAGRAIQGLGAALIAPAALTLLMVTFSSDGAKLTRALAVYGAAAPAGGSAGVFLGGVLTQFASWPWVFFINVPIAVAVLYLTPRVLPHVPGRAGRLDLVGAVTVTAGLATSVYTIVNAADAGWASRQTLTGGLVAVALVTTFVIVQRRSSNPLVRLGIFRAPNLAAANVAQFLLGAAWIPMWFFLNLYLQQILGLDAFASGAALLPMTLLIMGLMVGIAPRLIGRFGAKAMVVTGMGILAAGMGALALARPHGSFWVDVLPASLVAATGMALAFIPSLGIALSSARPDEGGLAAGLVNTSYQVGSALGLACLTAVAAAKGSLASGDVVSVTSGYSSAFLGAAIVSAAGAVIAVIALRSSRAPSQPIPKAVDDRAVTTPFRD